MPPSDLCDGDAVNLAGLLRARQVSAREVVAAHIKRIEEVDPAVNAVVTRTFDRALEKAAVADDAFARGENVGLLHGLPVAHKDLVQTAGVRTTFGSPAFADNVPDQDDLIVARMAGAGAISLGKTNTPEFGAGSHTVNKVFGATRNPYDLSRSAGGSSGGAAAALAARMVALADGSDLGGSLRNPASFCNVVGLRPSPGRVPVWPFSDVADWLSVEGPMARTVADVALLLAVISGPDARVPVALEAPPPALSGPAQVHELLTRDMRGVRVAWSPDLGGLPVDPAVRETLAPARQVLTDLGCEVIDATPDLTGADEGFQDLAGAEVRDGVRAAAGGASRRRWSERGVECSARAGTFGGRPEPRDATARGRGRTDRCVLREHRRAGVPSQPGTAVRHRSRLGARDRRRAAAHVPGLDAVGLPDLGDRAPGNLRSRGIHFPSARRCRIAAGWSAASRPPPRRLGTAVYRVRLRAGDGLRHDPAARA